eukprot:7320515-Prymnesium_polylepis.1
MKKSVVAAAAATTLLLGVASGLRALPTPRFRFAPHSQQHVAPTPRAPQCVASAGKGEDALIFGVAQDVARPIGIILA